MKITREKLNGYKVSGDEVLTFPNGDTIRFSVLVDFIIDKYGQTLLGMEDSEEIDK